MLNIQRLLNTPSHTQRTQGAPTSQQVEIGTPPSQATTLSPFSTITSPTSQSTNPFLSDSETDCLDPPTRTIETTRDLRLQI
jgi:hypothetical protein